MRRNTIRLAVARGRSPLPWYSWWRENFATAAEPFVDLMQALGSCTVAPAGNAIRGWMPADGDGRLAELFGQVDQLRGDEQIVGNCFGKGGHPGSIPPVEIKDMHDRAEGLRAYARIADDCLLEIEAAEIRNRSARPLGFRWGRLSQRLIHDSSKGN